MFCTKCNSNLLINHLLEDHIIPPMSNKSKIIYPKCSLCGQPIQLCDVSKNIKENQKVLLITGTAAAGKTSIGQLIEINHDYIFIDGDAIQKRENYFRKQNPDYKVNFYAQTINTMLILLALGYNVVVGYIIYGETLKMFVDETAKYGITPIFRVLVPERNVCIQRDIARECWTGGEKWVDEWYNDMRSFITTDKSICIDNSYETLEETYNKYFVKLL